ncbi:MAG: sensor domain-containing diguanylate cyclase [Acidovorax sp.]|uniref:GGDEF domain-containing protein n=1 Tax=Acidovorax sp. TaxID=1872122 RepID=UPI00261E1B4D|nr:sensor domain-containing diguanylate cyclase [Acidovorax sp.]MDH4426467.1 sensor domain-containing diguanylate cyclase [Acidovorax sp.]
MKTPDVPPDEASRLAALRSLNVLDTIAEERFDRLTRIAKRLFGVQVALVSLVDENRQWFKSCIGTDVRETPRAISFCGHAILGETPFVIPDALEDQRFADNPLVTGELHIRFYAGCPLRGPDRRKLGTLCIIDSQPRAFGKEDIGMLVDLASLVEREFAALEWATVDELTGLSNRRGFMLLAQHSIQMCMRQQVPSSLVFIDLDHLKAINDRFGHAEGDRALTTFAEHLARGFRHSDVLARLGGDEFVVLLTDHSLAAAETTMARLQGLLDATNARSPHGYAIGFSYGVVEFDPARHGTIDVLLDEGDRVMYEKKKAKR